MKTTGLILAALLLAGSADELAATQVGALKLKAPAAWKKQLEEGTTSFKAPSGDAYFMVDVGQVQREGGMPAEECIQKIVAGMGGEGFTRLTIGGQPAAVKVDLDSNDGGKTAVRTHTYVGCNGQTTWSLVFHHVESKKDRFAPLAEKVGKSVEYR